MIYTIEITTLIAVASIPTTNPYGQLSIIAMLGLLLWWQTAKVIPEIQRLHTLEVNKSLQAYSKSTAELTSEIKGLRKDLEERPCLGLEGFKKIEQALRCELKESMDHEP